MTTTAPAIRKTSYDLVPYTSHPFSATHPDRLATVATLMGLRQPRVEQCRVLELGCASGGNLIPMAIDLPHSVFLGIDLSVVQVEEGRRTIDRLGLKNVELLSMDLLEVQSELGQFDYVVCHGVYSWVPRPVRDKILSICSRNLAPNGVAYVSYNTYPGWHMRGMIRDMMAYHARRFRDTKKKVSQARALLDFLSESNSGSDGPYSSLLKQELQVLRDKADDYLLHEHLEDVNDPVYFYEFIRDASSHGLAYLGEAVLGTMSTDSFPVKVREALHRIAPNQVQREQYMDFLRNRMFRQTLLCHDRQKFSYAVEGGRVSGLHVASRAVPVATPDLTSNRADQFKGPDNATVNTRDPLLKAALLELASRWPHNIPFATLFDLTRDRVRAVGGSADSSPEPFGAGLVQCHLCNLVEFSARPTRFTATPSDRPAACPLAQLQAEVGSIVTNRRHERVKLPDPERQLLARLDGTRDRATLLEEMVELCSSGALTARHEGKPVEGKENIRRTVGNAMPGMLEKLARLALLIA